MKTLGLISCSAAKLREKAKYKGHELYSASTLFSKAYEYCTKKYNTVAILSAKYGLVFPDDEIEPYDKTLNRMSAKERKDWSKTVLSQMKTRLNLPEYQKCFFHAGKRYSEYLFPELENLKIKCEFPMEHLRIGEQLRFYNTHDC